MRSGEALQAGRRRGPLSARKAKRWRAATTIGKKRWLLDLVEGEIGNWPISELTAPEILAALRRIEARGLYETAVRARALVGAVSRYAVATARADGDPTQPLRGALITPTVTHRATIIEPRAIGALSPFLFPSTRSWRRYISENTLNAALRRIGYGEDEMTAHGFRAMAATRLNEMLRWHPDVIERALGHQEPNAVRRAYTSAVEYWPERVEMMQVWADYLDTLRKAAPT